jgi:hypothetical protein
VLRNTVLHQNANGAASIAPTTAEHKATTEISTGIGQRISPPLILVRALIYALLG